MGDNLCINEDINLRNCSVDELVSKITALTAHNLQLKNILAKTQNIEKTPKTKSTKKFDFNRCKFRHVFLKFFYLGWDYQGYVSQEDTTNTIEHHIFEALQKACLIPNRQVANYHRCGRTDKGVSSFSQVISLDIRSKSDDENEELDYCSILNRLLPDNIQFFAWSPVENHLSARFNCNSRTYKYFFPKGNLSIANMKKAASYIEGTHDFRNFCKMDVKNGVTEFIRHIQSVQIESFSQNDSDEYAICVMSIKSKAFLWHQIRCVMGILLLVGQQKEKPEIILELFDINKNPRQVIYEIIRWLWKINSSINVANLTAHFSKRPDYQIANEIPLNLYNCEYEDIKWIYRPEAMLAAMTKLQQFWTFTTIKSTMAEQMLIDMKKTIQKEILLKCPSENLISGVKPKKYIPVMKRQLCTSLEDKIEHFSKSKKFKSS